MAKKEEKTHKEIKKQDAYQEAINIVNTERTRWSDAVAFVTDKVAFQMRNMVRTFRKNYWGIFDYPVDSKTGREKTWVPLTRVLVEGGVKGTDLDTKDVNFRARNDKGYSITKLIRALVKKFLDSIFFGEILDETLRALAIDGTVVWKSYEVIGDDGKPKLIRKNVDLLNVYIDPTEDNIQTAFRFTERGLMLPSEIAQMDGWSNTTGLIGSTTISRIDGQYNSISYGTTARYRDVWEMWGKIPEYLITGQKSKDGKDKLVDGHLVVSGLEMSNPTCHLIERNTKKDDQGNPLKPYEEARYSKVSNRWYGLGIAEKVLMLQIWLNTIVNIRINRSVVSQLGLFKIKRGSGITPQMLSRLGANGAITVNDINDIEQMVMQEGSQSSYADEQNILGWGQKDTGAFDITIGEKTPAEKPATTSVLENNSSKSGFKIVKDQVGQFLERWIDRHALPVLAKTIDIGEMIEISDEGDIEDLVNTAVAFEGNQVLEDMYAKGLVPSRESLEQAMNIAVEKLLKRPNIFVKNIQKLVSSSVYTKVFVTNEEMDPSVMVQNIMQSLKVVPPEAQMPLVKEAMDLMGLDFKMPKPQPQAPPTPPPNGGGSGIVSNLKNNAQPVMSANTLK